MPSDRDLIGGSVVVWFGFASPQQLCAESEVDDGTTLIERLERSKLIDAQQRRLVDRFIESAVADNGGDLDRTLLALGGRRKLELTMGVSAATEAETLAPDTSDLETLDASTLDCGETLPTAAGDRLLAAGMDDQEVTDEPVGRYAYRLVDSEDEAGTKEQAEIGRGGIGRVLIVTDKHLRRDVAVKELLPHARARRKAGARGRSPVVDRFLREARVTGQLEHPNIVPVYEVGRRANGTLYYTMKLVRGRTLADALDEHPTLDGRLKLLGRFVDMCQAVAYAHSRGVVHRDLKPDNVMVGEFGETLVLDWGLAKVRGQRDLQETELEQRLVDIDGSDDTHTLAGDKMGTPAYMSPEQAEGRVQDVDERSDVWSLGAVLFEIITGEPPFHAGHPLKTLEQVVNNPVPDPAVLCPEVPPELASICRKALRRDRRRRYSGAGRLAAEVDAYLSGARVGAYEYGAWDLLRRFVSRYRAPLVVAGIATLLLVALGISAYVRVVSERDRAVVAERDAVEGRDRARVAEQHAEEREAYARRMLARAFVEKSRVALGAGDFAAAQTFAAAAAEHDDTAEARGLAVHAAGRRRAVLSWTSRPGAECLGLAWHPGGAQLACATSDGVRVWDVATGAQKATLRTRSWVAAVAYSPDGQLAATGGHDRAIRLWDVATGDEVAVLRGHGDKVWSVAFSPDGKTLASGSHDSTIGLWDVAGHKELARLQGHERKVWSVAFSPDGTRLLSGSTDGSVRIWDVAKRAEVRRMAGHERAVLNAVWSPDGRTVASASSDRTARLWDAGSGRALATLEGHEKSVIPVIFASQGRKLVTGSTDHSVRVWDVATRSELRKLGEHDGWVWSAALSPDGSTLATSGRDIAVRLWALESGEEVARLTGHGEAIAAAAFSPDGGRLATAGADKTARIWDAATGEQLACVSSHQDHATSVSWSPDAALLAVGSRDGMVWLWDVATKAERRRLVGQDGPVLAAAFSPNEQRLLSGTKSGVVRLWDTATGESLRREGGGSEVRALAWDAAGTHYAVGTLDGHVRVRRAATGEAKELSLSAPIDALAFSATGRHLAVAVGLKVELWEAAEPRRLRTLEGHSARVRAVAWGAGDRLVATAGDDTAVRIWDVATGVEQDRMETRAGRLTAVAWTAATSRLATVGTDPVVQVWDTASGGGAALAHGKPPLAVAWVGGGRTIASGGSGGSLRLWDAATGLATGLLGEGLGDLWVLRASAAGDVLAAASRDGKVRVWSPVRDAPAVELEGELGQLFGVALSADGKTLAWSDGSAHVLHPLPDRRTQPGPWAESKDPVRALALSPDGMRLAAADWGTKVALWDLDPPRRRGAFDVEPPLLSCLDFSPDSRLVLLGNTEGQVVLRDAGTLREVRRFVGLGAEVTSAVLTPNGATLVAASRVGQIHAFDAATGRPLARFAGHGGEAVRALAPSPDGRYVLSAGDDGSVRRWDLSVVRAPADQLLRVARARSGLDLAGVELQADPARRRTLLAPISER